MSPTRPEDVRWLDAAVRIARPYLGTTSSNPTAGALVVEPASQRLLGRGVTASGGRPHAERLALRAAGAAARGATLYLTLEPCAHWGRTPPCVDEIIRCGIKRVVIGVADPDPKTHGHGVARLKQAGVEVVSAHHGGCFKLHEGHISRQILGRPFLTAILAVSADGMVADASGARLQLSEEAQRWIQMQRAHSDGVLVGAETARIDNLDLTVELSGLESRTPLRVILAGSRALDPRTGLIAKVWGYRVAVVALIDKQLELPADKEVLRVGGFNGRPDLGEALSALSRKGIARLQVETGPTLLNGLFDAGFIDRFHLISTERELGARGIPARPHGSLEARLETLGFWPVDQAALGVDKLRTYERS